jgi:hypothetical protein
VERGDRVRRYQQYLEYGGAGERKVEPAGSLYMTARPELGAFGTFGRATLGNAYLSNYESPPRLNPTTTTTTSKANRMAAQTNRIDALL